MTYLTKLAKEIKSHIPKEKLPEENSDLLFHIYAVLALAKKKHISNEDVHNAWVAWMLTVDKNHESIKEFSELSKEIQEEDNIYVKAIKKAIQY